MTIEGRSSDERTRIAEDAVQVAVDLIRGLLVERDQLARWKAEVTVVLDEWDHVHAALGSPALLGQTKAAACLAAVQELRTDPDAVASGFHTPLPCPAERGTWDHFRPEQIDYYIMRCDLGRGHQGPHANQHTGATWET